MDNELFLIECNDNEEDFFLRLVVRVGVASLKERASVCFEILFCIKMKNAFAFDNTLPNDEEDRVDRRRRCGGYCCSI